MRHGPMLSAKDGGPTAKVKSWRMLLGSNVGLEMGMWDSGSNPLRSGGVVRHTRADEFRS
jgi:hypothetical protein